jgi:D-3-phosphoglycerate dehydrogenase
MTYKVFVSDKLSAEGIDVLKKNDEIDVLFEPGLSPDEQKDRIRDAHGLIVRSATTVTPDLLEAAGELKVIARAGIGVDNIDIEACTQRGVVVENTPHGNTTSAAEHAIALLFSLARHVPRADASMKAGKWDKKAFMGVELDGKTLGVVGAGNIGSIVCRKAVGLGMKVLAFDPYLGDEKAHALGIELAELDEVLARADALTCHVPLVEGTRGLIGKEALGKMKKGSLLVQASRGGVVDEAAVIEALDDGTLLGAAFDVYESEPLAEDHPLRGRPDVVLTPHLGASTTDAQIHVGVQAAEQVIALLTRGERIHALNDPK